MNCYVSFITGVLVGIELEETDECNYLHLNLFIVNIMFEWDK